VVNEVRYSLSCDNPREVGDDRHVATLTDDLSKPPLAFSDAGEPIYFKNLIEVCSGCGLPFVNVRFHKLKTDRWVALFYVIEEEPW
jgi:hypothetical protein